ncbi:putative inorganic carbon transporter subunit DabA [Halomonas sp.]|uniref:putative inorganic carbon transporter subunit DabA n=1 Tax=Halomonas sp. TaxID=1486246 RepID=UPI00384CEBC5
MTQPALAPSSGTREAHRQALMQAAERIAPTWPLDRWIAVNPWWGMKAQPIEEAEAQLARRAGVTLTMPPEFYRQAWASGRIQPEDLRRAVAMSDVPHDEASLIARLEESRAAPRQQKSAWEMLADNTPAAANDAFEPVAELCASYFDHHQQRWETTPDETLFRWWRTQTRHDRRLKATLRQRIDALPTDTESARDALLADLALSPDALEALTHALLLRVNGWASWCQGLAWHTPDASQHAGIEELIVILLAWEWLGRAELDTRHCDLWQAQWEQPPSTSAADRDSLWFWQHAYELGYQRRLSATLATRPSPRQASAEVQVAFCIDVRSERLRRHIEGTSPEVDTLGVAGFFGMPITHVNAGPARALPRVPGLLTPRYQTEEAPPLAALHRHRYRQEAGRQGIRHAKYHALSTFTLVETTGLAWGWKLLRDSRARCTPSPSPAPVEGPFQACGGEPLALKERVALALGLVGILGLGTTVAPLLVLVGHDSQSDNNPHHAGLTCGACGGQGGGVNAQLAARLLNDSEVRRELAARGVPLPATTHVLAATHCTLTDRVTLMDTHAVPARLSPLLERFEQTLEQAGRATRAERAIALGVNASSDERRLEALQQRGSDWSQPRPEWGLANNAALLLAPRSISRGLALEGRVFLHEYDPHRDPDGQTLEALMTAPMLVASWINLQYYASVAVPSLYGAGNKLLHSVVGGHIGVIEGNSPQLRIGLPHQSLHDGTTWCHEPLRLTVVIDAPRERIEGVLTRQPAVAQLVHNRWLWLCRHTADGLEHYHAGGWLPS